MKTHHMPELRSYQVQTFDLLARNFPIEHGNCHWDAIVDGVAIDGLCWDEMLGLVAHCAYNLWSETPKPSVFERDYPSPYVTKFTMRCTRIEGTLWTIELLEDGRFNDHLTACELLGFIAAFTVPARSLFGGFKTYEHVINCRSWHRNVQIAGLLPHGEMVTT